MANRLQQANPNQLPPLQVALLPPILLAGLSFLPRVSANPRLVASFWGSAAILLVFFFLLRRHVIRTGHKLHYESVPAKVHYIQGLMQFCIYVYWGKYWSPVYQQAPLILAQLVFLYGLDMLICWWRRDNWVLGFGPFPIILSTNLFLWYKDEWFFLQFLMDIQSFSHCAFPFFNRSAHNENHLDHLGGGDRHNSPSPSTHLS